MLVLALRNVQRNLKRIRPMILLLMFSFLLLFFANGILEYVSNSFSSFYIQSVSGHLAVSANTKENFTLFGTDTLLVGDFIAPPVVSNYNELTDSVKVLNGYESSLGIITSAAQLELGSHKKKQLLFGVDFEQYVHFFPDIELVIGQFPKKGENGILIQKHYYDELVQSQGKDVLGEVLLLAVAYESSFSIQEAVLSGVISFNTDDALMNNVAVIDINTARNLNGYVTSNAASIDLSEEQDDLFFLNEEDFFSGFAVDESGMDTAGPSSILEVDFNAVENEQEVEVNVNSNAFNFLLIKLGHNNISAAKNSLQTALDAEHYVVKDWREVVGGSALVIWFLQIIINLGLFFIIIGVATVTTNAITLSIFERSKEIGTMRALGATRLNVSVMVFIETGITVFGAAFTGVLLGMLSLFIFNQMGIVIDNSYIKLLFGNGAISGAISLSGFLLHVLFALILLLFSVILPLKRLLELTPRMAMA